MLNGKMTAVPLEVVLLITVGAWHKDSDVTPALLDWYDLDTELIMVLEKPEPCMDLEKYIRNRPDCMTEDEVKVSNKCVAYCVRVSFLEIKTRATAMFVHHLKHYLLKINKSLGRVFSYSRHKELTRK